MFRAAPMAVFPTAAFGSDPRVLAADIPAGAKVTARALARLHAGWLGEVDGTRVVSAERLAAASAESSSGPDQVYGNESRWGLGFCLGLPWDGAVAVTKNVLSMDFVAVQRIVGAILDAVR